MTTETNTAPAPKKQRKAPEPKTFGIKELAAKVGVKEKSLRQRIRNNEGKWKPLIIEGAKREKGGTYRFRDNKTTWEKARALAS